MSCFKTVRRGPQQKEKKLWFKLKGAWSKVEKWLRINVERHSLIEKLDLQNRGLRRNIASLTEELSTAHESIKVSEG